MIEFKKAVRKAVPLLVGIVGPSGTGKTFSALRLARGMQKVMGGRIKFIDTEHGRALQYADYFDFDYFPFEPPYSSLRYLEILQTAAKTPGPVIVDSMSHEHEGPGGYIDLHDQEVKRLIDKGGFRNEFSAGVPAWALPSKNRQILINGIVTSGINAIFCFRAKEKVNMNADKLDRQTGQPTGEKTVGNLGWMPIAGDAFVYEMTCKCLLLPGANGIPSWNPEFPGEKQMAKIPIFFKDLFAQPAQLSEEIGESLATWASGRSESPYRNMPFPDLISAIAAAQTEAELILIWEWGVRPQWKSFAKPQQDLIGPAWKSRKEAVLAPGFVVSAPKQEQVRMESPAPQSDDAEPLPGEMECLAAKTAEEIQAAWSLTKWRDASEEQLLRSIFKKQCADLGVDVKGITS